MRQSTSGGGLSPNTTLNIVAEMETRGAPATENGMNRAAIARRSCDQCRLRKIGCDRGTPCSNCTSARVECTHSAVASQPSSSRQRVLISAEYERKIDGIVRDIDAIKLALQNPSLSASGPGRSDGDSCAQLIGEDPEKAPCKPSITSEATPTRQWDHPVQIIDFVKAVVESGVSDHTGKSSQAISSLKNLVYHLESASASHVSAAEKELSKRPPPLDAVVAILRWAKSHKDYLRIAWIGQILKLQTFEDICRKVYFAVDDYTDVEFIVAHGFLFFVFAEHALSTGAQSSREHCYLSRTCLSGALLKLTYVLPASSEVIAALVFGALNSIENSDSNRAWEFISGALSRCHTLGYHRVSQDDLPENSRTSLFWVVYRLERSLSLRLGRSSGIRDAEITLSLHADAPRSARVGKIQGEVYDQLYSPGSTLGPEERNAAAQQLASEVRELLHQIRADISDATEEQPDNNEDSLRPIYLHCDLVCHSSLLVLILRATPTASPSGVPEECICEARNTLSLHHQCMMMVKDCNDPLLLARYLNWAMLHVPFVPFSILFTHAVQNFDQGDLSLLEQFAASLKPQDEDSQSITHPHQLYSLLCETARFYLASRPQYPLLGSSLLADGEDMWIPEGFSTAVDGALEPNDVSMSGPTDWYLRNQQLMNLLDDYVLY